MSPWARFLRPASFLILLFACAAALPPSADAQAGRPKLDKTLSARARVGAGESRVIVTFKPGWDATEDAKRLGAKVGRRLRSGSRVLRVSNTQLERLANHPGVERVSWDRPVSGLPIVGSTVGKAANSAAETLGYSGKGIGVAVIDSGITPWHDELTYQGNSPRVQVNGGQRIASFVDYTQSADDLPPVEGGTPYDDYGHGTYVAGIIAGNGLGSNGARKGAAPEAHLVVLKVLDRDGRGSISDVADALYYAIEHKRRFNIRVVNMSIAAAVPEGGIKEDLEDGVLDDELAVATKAAVEAGLVVVAAAGNLGFDHVKNAPQYGGITAPGNAPWVLTVGAYDHKGTANPNDDVIAPFSSRGPTAYDYFAKPDVVAPGMAIASLADANSKLYERKGPSDQAGHYISLSGTSVAAPVVSGTVALMAQAYPALTPNLAKAVVQYTAAFHPDYNALTQGAGFVNPLGAVELSRYFAKARHGSQYPRDKKWSRTIIWGNYQISGGAIWPGGSAWSLETVWGAMPDEDGDNIVWGTLCPTEDCDNIVWGTFDDGFNIVWGTDEDGDNIVWGTACGDRDGAGEDCDNIVWGTNTPATEDVDNLVWGTACTAEDCDNIVWGTCEDCDNIVWGTLEDLDNVVWGTDCGGEDCDNIVWGTCEDCDNIVWGTACGEDCDNIVWGTCLAEDMDNIVWGTTCDENNDCTFNIVWGTDLNEDGVIIVWGTSVTTVPPVAAPPAPWKAETAKPRGPSRR